MRPFLLLGFVATFLGWALAFSARAADEFEQSPIEYSRSTPDNRVSKLQARLDSGDLRLAFDKERGFLSDLLKVLDIPIESQTLVFSKTSLQRHRISPKKPRAIYFSDDVYVGFCQQGDDGGRSAIGCGLLHARSKTSRRASPRAADGQLPHMPQLLAQRQCTWPCFAIAIRRQERPTDPVGWKFFRGSQYSLGATLGWLVRDREAWVAKAHGQLGCA